MLSFWCKLHKVPINVQDVFCFPFAVLYSRFRAFLSSNVESIQVIGENA